MSLNLATLQLLQNVKYHTAKRQFTFHLACHFSWLQFIGCFLTVFEFWSWWMSWGTNNKVWAHKLHKQLPIPIKLHKNVCYCVKLLQLLCARLSEILRVIFQYCFKYLFVCFRRFLIQFHMSTFTKFFILSETIEFNTQKTPIKT